MVNDPKFRTISKASKQPVTAVLSVYLHVLTSASENATERGRTQANAENVASALDLETEQVQAIFAAMQGRLLDGDRVSGWEKRQPKREDNSAERSRVWREEKKAAAETERNRTQSNAEKRPDTDTDTDIERAKALPETGRKRTSYPPEFEAFWRAYPAQGRKEKPEALKEWKAARHKAEAEEIMAGLELYGKTREVRDGYVPYAAKWLKRERWAEDHTAEQTKPQRSWGVM